MLLYLIYLINKILSSTLIYSELGFFVNMNILILKIFSAVLVFRKIIWTNWGLNRNELFLKFIVTCFSVYYIFLEWIRNFSRKVASKWEIFRIGIFRQKATSDHTIRYSMDHTVWYRLSIPYFHNGIIYIIEVKK